MVGTLYVIPFNPDRILIIFPRENGCSEVKQPGKKQSNTMRQNSNWDLPNSKAQVSLKEKLK